MTAGNSSIAALWASTPQAAAVFDPAQVADLPAAAQSYLRHVIAAGTPLASAVRLKMHGEIKLKKWYPFTAEQIIAWERGMIWQAAARMGWLSIRGSDSLLAGAGRMRWRLFGLVPVMSASGPDITRSAAGRVNIESVWLPSVLCRPDVAWECNDGSNLVSRFVAHGEPAEIAYRLAATGAPKSVSMRRWGNPGGDSFRLTDFGGFVEEEKRFGGYTIPTRMRIGWYFGSDRFETEGEFFRVCIDGAEFR
jgi:hypothetical protein